MKELERIIESEADDNAWRQHITRYEFAKDWVQGKAVLDVACGTGYGSNFLAQNGVARITGVDISQEAIAHARLHYTHPGLEYRNGDALQLEPYAGVDAIISLETIEHLPEPEKFLDAVVRILPPHGVFIVSTPNRATGQLTDKPKNPFHLREWSSAEFMELLHRYFPDVVFYDQFVYIAGRWYPGARTIGRLMLKGFRREVLQGLYRWEVTEPLDIDLPLVKLQPKYVIAVCRKPGT